MDINISCPSADILVNITGCDKVLPVAGPFDDLSEGLVLSFGLAAVIVFSIIFVVGMAGNALVCYVLLVSGAWSTPSNVLLLSLALDDMIMLVCSLPWTVIQYIFTNWAHSDFSCKIIRYITFSCIYVDVYTLLFVAVIRFLALTRPIKSGPYRTRGKVFCYLICIWIAAFLVNIPVAVGAGVVGFVYRGEIITMCLVLDWDNSGREGAIFHGMFFLLTYLLPLVSIIILTLVSVWRVRSRYRHVQLESGGKRRLIAVRALACVVATYAFCLLPVNIVWILTYFEWSPGKDDAPFLVVKFVTTVLLYLNACLNPVLYHYLSRKFRQDCHRLFGLHGIDAQPAAVIIRQTVPPSPSSPSVMSNGCDETKEAKVKFTMVHLIDDECKDEEECSGV